MSSCSGRKIIPSSLPRPQKKLGTSDENRTHVIWMGIRNSGHWTTLAKNLNEIILKTKYPLPSYCLGKKWWFLSEIEVGFQTASFRKMIEKGRCRRVSMARRPSKSMSWIQCPRVYHLPFSKDFSDRIKQPLAYERPLFQYPAWKNWSEWRESNPHHQLGRLEHLPLCDTRNFHHVKEMIFHFWKTNFLNHDGKW